MSTKLHDRLLVYALLVNQVMATYGRLVLSRLFYTALASLAKLAVKVKHRWYTG